MSVHHGYAFVYYGLWLWLYLCMITIHWYRTLESSQHSLMNVISLLHPMIIIVIYDFKYSQYRLSAAALKTYRRTSECHIFIYHIYLNDEKRWVDATEQMGMDLEWIKFSIIFCVFFFFSQVTTHPSFVFLKFLFTYGMSVHERE